LALTPLEKVAYAKAAGEEWEGKPLEVGDEAMVAVVR
jgi:hypothetical protein